MQPLAEEAQARLQQAARQVAQAVGEAERPAREAADAAAAGTAIAAYWIFAACGPAPWRRGSARGSAQVTSGGILARRRPPAAPAV
jgi:hypothetical protein